MFTIFDKDGDYLPESFSRLQAIEEIDFSDWLNLKELPENIGDMRNLRVINLSNKDRFLLGNDAEIKELPESLGQLANLEELDIFGLQDLKKLPSSFARLKQLKRLDIVGSGINELQLTTDQWNNLEDLCMQGPLPDLRQCANLKKFYYFKNGVSFNYIKGSSRYGLNGTDELIKLPLSPLRKLESLKISGGALDSTDFLTSMINLRVLSLSCDFDSFPPGFEKLDKLEEIYIFGAKSLSSLPECLGHLPMLKELRLTHCGLKALPTSVCERKDLLIDIDCCPVKWPE